MPGRRYGGIRVGSKYVRISRRHQAAGAGGGDSTWLAVVVLVIFVFLALGWLQDKGLAGLFVGGGIVLFLGWIVIVVARALAPAGELNAQGATVLGYGTIQEFYGPSGRGTWYYGRRAAVGIGHDAAWVSDGQQLIKIPRPLTIGIGRGGTHEFATVTVTGSDGTTVRVWFGQANAYFTWEQQARAGQIANAVGAALLAVSGPPTPAGSGDKVGA
jgi:hypothetical protein